MTSERGKTEPGASILEQCPSTGDFTLRRRIEPWEFSISYDPRELCKETCLLYEIKWGMSWKIWRSSGKNTTNHVEVNFIEKFTSERHFHSSVSCSITWFLSWSPCWECSQAIREFLSQHPGVTLVIYVARLFQHMDQQNRQGLRELVNSGVTIQIMTASGSSTLFKDFKKMAKSTYIFQTSPSELPLPNDFTTNPFSDRADPAFCDLEMNRVIPCVS
ncbi:C-_U-editing enzyme APOBEC-1 isoform X3 [Saimiri boliviensis]|uniref:C->U-editing enzyme APOBEC-1 isoform X3 n=1 Tax=Saimiri boliviensis TaxID=27679 RepID=UPI003D77B1DD